MVTKRRVKKVIKVRCVWCNKSYKLDPDGTFPKHRWPDQPMAHIKSVPLTNCPGSGSDPYKSNPVKTHPQALAKKRKRVRKKK